MDRVTNADVRLRAGSPPPTAAAAAHPNKTVLFLLSFGKHGRLAGYVYSLTYVIVNSRAPQELETPPRTSTSHLAMDFESQPSAANPRTQLGVATRSRSQLMEAARGNAYVLVRCPGHARDNNIILLRCMH